MLKKKKVLILQNTILHYRKSLYNELSKLYDVTVLHSGKNAVTEDDKFVEIIKNKKKIGPFYIQEGVLSEVKNNSYDVIISMFDLHWVNNILAMYLHNKNSKFIWWGTWFSKNYIGNKIKLYLTNQNYSSIFYTKEAKESFVKSGVAPQKLFVANNTFDIGKRSKCYENKSKNSILFVGSLDKRKQNDVLINAFYNIKDKIPLATTLIIIGEGEEKENLQFLVNKLDLNKRVIFAGKITDTNELLNFYSQAIVSVSFGQAGLSVLQSLGFGVPFITKKNAVSGGEKTNIIHGTNGFFCEDNINSLESYILELCLKIDFARKLGNQAYTYYSRFCTIANMAQGFSDAIENTRKAN